MMLEYQHIKTVLAGILAGKTTLTLKLFRIRLVASENRRWQLCWTLIPTLRGALTRVSHQVRRKITENGAASIAMIVLLLLTISTLMMTFDEMFSTKFSFMTMLTSPASLRFRAANLSFLLAALSSRWPTCCFQKLKMVTHHLVFMVMMWWTR